jgi:K+ transporter
MMLIWFTMIGALGINQIAHYPQILKAIIAVMLYFRESSHMEAAYGFSITIAMLMTTILMFYYMKFHKKWPVVIIRLVSQIYEPPGLLNEFRQPQRGRT